MTDNNKPQKDDGNPEEFSFDCEEDFEFDSEECNSSESITDIVPDTEADGTEQTEQQFNEVFEDFEPINSENAKKERQTYNSLCLFFHGHECIIKALAGARDCSSSFSF